MVKYEYLPLSASDRNAEGSDQIHYPPGQPGADPGKDAQAQLPSGNQPVLPNEGESSSETGGAQTEDALILQETVSIPQSECTSRSPPRFVRRSTGRTPCGDGNWETGVFKKSRTKAHPEFECGGLRLWHTPRTGAA